MTDYAAVSDVESRLRSWLTTPFTVSTNPTLATATDYIEQVEAEINGVLSALGYAAIPATGTNDVKMLRRYVSQYTAVIIWEDLYHNEGDLPQPFRRWADSYNAFLKALRNGEQDLIDQNPQGDDDPVFLIVRTPERDDTFTSRKFDATDWDE